MKHRFLGLFKQAAVVSLLGWATASSAQPRPQAPTLPLSSLATQYFGADAPWYLANIPFLEIDDPEIQQIYYYRWKVYRSHIRQIGPQGTTVLEFLPNVPWARQPYTDLNDSASFHLMEGRWLRNPTTVDDLIDHLYTGGGNDRHFSESIAAATYATTLVTGDPAPALRHLDTMQHIYNLWDDHFDRQRNLYWIEPLLDATEYTISSIDASGAGFTNHPSTDQNHNGFTGGFAFRPSINSYQYANALAIAHLATLAHQSAVASDYTARAERLRTAVLTQLWNPTLQHFTDIYQRSTSFVTAGNFIRGRELVGYTPWLYELPPTTRQQPFDRAWQHLLDPQELAGPYGLRTVEPSYPKYLMQYRYDAATGQPECQWNGPSWPFQTSQALTALANLLDDYPAAGPTRDDYLRLLRQYTHQHFLTPGHPDIQEDYNPETGRPIVGLPRSHHYLHSTYIDLILNGLLGIRPRPDNTLELAPLLPAPSDAQQRPIRYFFLQHLAYRGHDFSILYDADGTRYHVGRGLTVYMDGHRLRGPMPLGHILIPFPPAKPYQPHRQIDLAINPGFPYGPQPTASSGTAQQIAQAIDGRMWFFPEIPNGWSPTSNGPGWYAVDLRQPHALTSIKLFFLAEGNTFTAPSSYRLQYQSGNAWHDIPQQTHTPQRPIAGGVNTITFPELHAQSLRVLFSAMPASQHFRLIEFEAFGPTTIRNQP